MGASRLRLAPKTPFRVSDSLKTVDLPQSVHSRGKRDSELRSAVCPKRLRFAPGVGLAAPRTRVSPSAVGPVAARTHALTGPAGLVFGGPRALFLRGRTTGPLLSTNNIEGVLNCRGACPPAVHDQGGSAEPAMNRRQGWRLCAQSECGLHVEVLGEAGLPNHHSASRRNSSRTSQTDQFLSARMPSLWLRAVLVPQSLLPRGNRQPLSLLPLARGLPADCTSRRPGAGWNRRRKESCTMRGG